MTTASRLGRADLALASLNDFALNAQMIANIDPRVPLMTTEKIAAARVRWSIEAAIFQVALWHSLAPTLRRLYKQYGTVFVADHVFAAQPSEIRGT
jgi:hypothetical protein